MICGKRALTFIEMVVALAVMAIVFAVILPQFRNIHNSWDTRQGVAEAIQNGRVLTDHLYHNLSKAVRITAVSDSSESDGFIEFEDNSSNSMRYDVAANNYVEFGPVGDLSDLTGPVSQLQFTCYDSNDFNTPVTDVSSIRLVKVRTTLNNSSGMGHDETFTTYAYLRINANSSSGSGTQSTYDYANRTQGTDIFAYDGQGSPQVPMTSTTPSDVLNSVEYDDIEYDDGAFHVYNVSSNGKFAQMRFVIYIDSSESDIMQITATWNGKCVNQKSNKSDGASLYVWNYASSSYELLEASADTEAEITLIDTLTDSIADYIGGVSEDTITLFAVSNDKKTGNESLELFTDYIKLEITATSGGSELLP